MKAWADGQGQQLGGVSRGGASLTSFPCEYFLDCAVVQDIYFKDYRKHFLVKMHIFLRPGGIWRLGRLKW